MDSLCTRLEQLTGLTAIDVVITRCVVTRPVQGAESQLIGSRSSDHYFRSVCWFVCLFVCLFVCAEFFSAVFDPISIKLGHMLHVWV